MLSIPYFDYVKILLALVIFDKSILLVYVKFYVYLTIVFLLRNG